MLGSSPPVILALIGIDIGPDGIARQEAAERRAMRRRRSDAAPIFPDGV
jgi:hypothetical protein